jgi:hypothetical protein
MNDQREERKRAGDRLYEQYGRPLEPEHRGQYLAIMPDGRTLLGDSLVEVAEQAKDEFGPGSFLFKLGPKAVLAIR